jgi:hypothetical protein
MPETRYIDSYSWPAGTPAADKIPANATITQTPYEVSDAELALEAITAETTIENDKAKVAWDNWAGLSLAQKDRVLKGLLGEYIGRNKDKYL